MKSSSTPPSKLEIFSWRRFFIALAAVVLGNVIYLFLLPLLPERAQHDPFRLDWGLILDFWICVVIYNLLLMFFKPKRG